MIVWRRKDYDFTGKAIVPFCTHEGSVLKGLAIYGSAIDSAKASISNWLDKIVIS